MSDLPDQFERHFGGVPDRSRSQNELNSIRVAAETLHGIEKPPQDICHVRAETAAVSMGLV
jgi:hypothetical protein